VRLFIHEPTKSLQWLVRAIDNHRLGSGARLKAIDARNLRKPIKVPLRTRDKLDQTQDALVRWIKNLNPRAAYRELDNTG
jgi:hypothetical protein